MLRNSIVYRRLWYVRKRNIGRIHILLRLLAAGAILAFLLALVNGSLVPRLKSMTEFKIKSMVTDIMEKSVRDTRDKDRLSGEIPDKLALLENTTVQVPVYGLFEKSGDIVDYSQRPALDIVIKQVGNVKTDFDGEFIYIYAVVKYSGPLTEGIMAVNIHVRCLTDKPSVP